MYHTPLPLYLSMVCQMNFHLLDHGGGMLIFSKKSIVPTIPT